MVDATFWALFVLLKKRRSLSSCSISTGPTCPANTAVVVDKIVQTPKSIEVNTTVTFSPKGRMWVQLVNTTEEDIFIPARTAIGCAQLATTIDDNSVVCERGEIHGNRGQSTNKRDLLNTTGMIGD